MRLLCIIPTAGFICLSAVVAQHSALPREERDHNLRRNGKRRIKSRKQTRGLNIYDDRRNRNHYTRRPTRRPTKRPDTRRPTRRPTKRPAIAPSSASTSTFRLKLYWQEGYNWQGDDDDPFYCMECSSSSNCSVGNEIIIKHCSSASDQQFTEVGGTIRPVIDTSLCFTIMGYDRAEDNDGDPITDPIQLQPCEGDNSNQQFVGFQSSGKFELSPIDRADRCLGQAHHPKSYEMIHPKSCAVARRETTSSWITY